MLWIIKGQLSPRVSCSLEQVSFKDFSFSGCIHASLDSDHCCWGALPWDDQLLEESWQSPGFRFSYHPPWMKLFQSGTTPPLLPLETFGVSFLWLIVGVCREGVEETRRAIGCLKEETSLMTQRVYSIQAESVRDRTSLVGFLTFPMTKNQPEIDWYNVTDT